MTCSEITKYLEDWAPKGSAWEKDNVGIQVGDINKKIDNILLSLDLTEEVLDDAIKKNCNFIITHHPLIFYPLKNIDTANNETAMLIERLIKNNIAVYSAHTNLDFTKDGVSFVLAKKIGLNNIRFLSHLKENQFKLGVFVPKDNLNNVAEAMHNKGAGIIGNYSNCSFRTEGTGTFFGSENSNPVIGKKNKIEKVNEVKLEVLVDEWNLKDVINSMLKSHPYEEPAYDIYPLKNENKNFGAGAIGSLKTPLSKNDFLKLVSKKLNIKNLRFAEGLENKIKSVAVCGGSGSDLLETAIKNKADAFITSDIKYHTFQDARNKILLIDAGHFETEILVLDELQNRLNNFIGEKNKTKVLKFNGSTNPVNFYNN